MTPAELVHFAHKKSPSHWKGRQTMIRRLARTQGLSEKTMHEALRLGAKSLRKDPSFLGRRTFFPNPDTPSDLRAEYLKEPSTYGLSKKSAILAWAQGASAATLLKMTRQSDVAAVELFRRDHPDASSRIRSVLENGDNFSLAWLKCNLAGQPWTDKQFNAMISLATVANAYKLWHDQHALLSQFFEEADQRAMSSYDSEWLANCLGFMDLKQLLEPTPSKTLHKAMLVEAYRLVCKGTPAQKERYIEYTESVAQQWYQHSPGRQDCLDLANRLDQVFNDSLNVWPYHCSQDWQNREPIVAPFIAMLGRNPEEGASALETYKTVDPSLLTFSTLAMGLDRPCLDNIDVSELLCP